MVLQVHAVVQLVLLPLHHPAAAGHDNKALLDTDAEGGGEGQSKKGEE